MEHIKKEIEGVTMQYEKAMKIDGHALIIEKNNERKYILSKYDPVREAKRIVSEYEANKETLWIVLGFCLGYVVDQIIERAGKEAKILVIEPNTTILEKQLDMTKDSKWDQYENLKMFSGTEFQELKDAYLVNSGFASYNNTNIIYTKEYQEYYIKYYTRILKIIADTRAQSIINQNTAEFINITVLLNIIKNQGYISNGYDITYHKDKYKGIPALIVSSGPSLEKNIHLLKEFKGIILTVGRSLTSVLNQGVEPNFVATLDTQDIIYDTFMGNTKTSIPLLATASANTKVLEDSKGPHYFADNDVDIIKAVTGLDVQQLQMGGSVATLCLSAAQYMGCNPIVFVGQDLAFTGMKRHASDCIISQDSEIDEDVSSLKLIKSYDDGTVYSDYALIGFRNWIEDFINLHNDTTYINATEGGAYIEGAIHQPLSEVVEKYKNITKPQLEHVRVKKEDVVVEESIRDSILSLKKMNGYTRQGELLAKKLLNEYVVYKGNRQNQVDKILRRLSKIDEAIEQLDKGCLANLLFTEIYNQYLLITEYQESLNEELIDKGIRVSTFNHRVYQALKNKSAEWVEKMEDVMEGYNAT